MLSIDLQIENWRLQKIKTTLFVTKKCFDISYPVSDQTNIDMLKMYEIH